MHGQLLELLVTEGESVKTGQKIAVLEAMKMQHDILAEIDGVVSDIQGTAGTQIAQGSVILQIDEID